MSQSHGQSNDHGGSASSIVFETDRLAAIVTRIGDKILLATIGPSRLTSPGQQEEDDGEQQREGQGQVEHERVDDTVDENAVQPRGSSNGSSRSSNNEVNNQNQPPSSVNGQHKQLHQYEPEQQHEIDRLSSLHLSTSPEILLALESKSFALGKYLAHKLEDLHIPKDF